MNGIDNLADSIVESGMIEVLSEIARNLSVIAAALAPAPEIRRQLADYPGFEWSSIGARIIASDADGPTLVEHGGKVYKRRSPDNKFGACIWYSRADGKDSEGNNEYRTLISFEILNCDVEPIGQKARTALAQIIRSRPDLSTDRRPPAGKVEIASNKPDNPPASASHLRVLDSNLDKLAQANLYDPLNPDSFKAITGFDREAITADNILMALAKVSDKLNSVYGRPGRKNGK